MNEAERRVVEAIDVEVMVAYLCDLISVPSLGAREAKGQAHVAAEMRHIGLAVDGWDLEATVRTLALTTLRLCGLSG